MIRLRLLFLLALAFWVQSGLAADRIVYARVGPTESRLFISNADGSAERPLTQAGTLNYDPVWSPKGHWIVFTSERDGSADLFRMHPDGGGVEKLTSDPAYDDQAGVSPNGKEIVFVSTRAAGRANLWILDLATRGVKRLTSGNGGDFRPAWSPDGRWIAFSSDRGSDFPPAKNRWERLQLADIYLIHPDGSGLRRISRRDNFCGSPRWTQDSKSVLAYCMSAEDTWTYRTHLLDAYPAGAENQIFKINIATGRTVPVTSGLGVKLAPTVLRSGQIAWLEGDASGLAVTYDGGKHGPRGQDLSPQPPAWSPDGTRIVYARSRYDPTPEPVQQWSRNPRFQLYATTWLPAYDPSGKRLAVSQNDPDGTVSLAIVEGGKPACTILKRKDLVLYPQWSPDGKQIVVGVGAFSSFGNLTAPTRDSNRVNGGAQVAILNADGTGFHVVTSGANNNAFASFSPDGRHLVYRTAGPEGEGLRILDLGDHAITVLTNEYDNFPVWSPRGDLIAFMRKINGDFEIMTIHPDGKDLQQLTHTHGNDAHPAWSPDGERLVFASSRTGFKDEAPYTGAPQPYGEIFVMRHDGTDVEQLTDDQWEDGGPAWQPDSSGTVGRIVPHELQARAAERAIRAAVRAERHARSRVGHGI